MRVMADEILRTDVFTPSPMFFFFLIYFVHFVKLFAFPSLHMIIKDIVKNPQAYYDLITKNSNWF